MSDSANGLGLPRTGPAWPTPYGNEWTPAEPGPTGDAVAGDEGHVGHHEDDVRSSSYFHVRWLGEVD